MPLIRIKRIYDAASRNDGYRVLVDRLWPRGMSKKKANVDLWLKEAAPSDELRKWYHQEPQEWSEFKERYFAELRNKKDVLEPLKEKLAAGCVTFLYGSKNSRLNNAVALKEYLENKSEAGNDARIH